MERKSEYVVFKIIFKILLFPKNVGASCYSRYNLRYKKPKGIPVVFQNDSTYNYHFIIKELTEEFEGQFEWLGENAEKYLTFSVPI